MREALPRPSLRRAAKLAPVVLVAALLVTVAGVGAVAAVAETQQTWRWYFRMEQVVSAATPVAVGLSAASVIALFGAVLLTDD